MTNQDIYAHVDHTQLKAFATWPEIEQLCREAEEYGMATVCIPPSFVSRAAAAFPKVTVCTVVGFPLGYNTLDTKVYEAKLAVAQGCVTQGGAEYIKTSTGFGTAGADLKDIALFKQHIGPRVKIKASGGIRTREAIEGFLAAGCDRIGASGAIAALEGRGE